jgi:isoquinoline 1-oxidoreductase
MNTSLPPEYEEAMEPVGYDFGLKRRSFVQLLGAGLLLAVSVAPALAQQRRGRGGGGGAGNIAARVHLGKDGTITVMTGKVEGGQGARAELSEAAAEELRVPVGRIQLVMADTGLVQACKRQSSLLTLALPNELQSFQPLRLPFTSRPPIRG